MIENHINFIARYCNKINDKFLNITDFYERTGILVTVGKFIEC